jgi:ABC-2 type transport system ATP-binding protein
VEWAALQPGLVLVDRTKRGARFDFTAAGPDELSLLLRRAVGEGIPVSDFHRQERRLEDAFVEVLRKSNGSTPKEKS